MPRRLLGIDIGAGSTGLSRAASHYLFAGTYTPTRAERRYTSYHFTPATRAVAYLARDEKR